MGLAVWERASLVRDFPFMDICGIEACYQKIFHADCVYLPMCRHGVLCCVADIASHGYKVRIYDANPLGVSTAMQRLVEDRKKLVENGLVLEDNKFLVGHLENNVQLKDVLHKCWCFYGPLSDTPSMLTLRCALFG